MTKLPNSHIRLQNDLRQLCGDYHVEKSHRPDENQSSTIYFEKEIEMKTNKLLLVVLTALLVVLPSACATQQSGHAKAELPVDKGYAEGKDIYFMHTEASDADLAEKMAAGMQSPVLYVPTHPEAELPTIMALPDQIRQVALNLPMKPWKPCWMAASSPSQHTTCEIRTRS